MKKWVSLLLMVGFCSLAHANEEDGMNSVGSRYLPTAAGTYQMHNVGYDSVFVMDTRTGELNVCDIAIQNRVEFKGIVCSQKPVYARKGSRHGQLH